MMINEKRIYFEILLDWLEESRPFFIERKPQDKKLIDLVACFITAACGAAIVDLKAFKVNEDYRVEYLDPFSFDCSSLPSGSRIVFSFRDILSENDESNNFPMAFLKSDRLPLLSRWGIESHFPLQLPRIYDPTKAVQVSSELDEKVHQILCYPPSDPSHLLVRGKHKTYIIDLDHWGEDECVNVPAFNEELNSISCLFEGLSENYFFLVANGRPYKVTLPDLAPVEESMEESVSWEEVLHVKVIDRHNRWFLFKNGTIRGFTPHEEFDLDIGADVLYSGMLEYLRNGKILAIDGNLKILKALHIHSCQRDTLFQIETLPEHFYFCLDKEEILYLLEGEKGRMHILLPAGHRVCRSCGYHCAHNAKHLKCRSCGIKMRNITQVQPYVPWMTLNLSLIGLPLGPIAIDDALNIYLCTQDTQIVVFTLSRKDMWGMQED